MSKNTDKQNAALINTLVGAANLKRYSEDSFGRIVTTSILSENDLEAIRQRIMHLVLAIESGETKNRPQTTDSEVPKAVSKPTEFEVVNGIKQAVTFLNETFKLAAEYGLEIGLSSGYNGVKDQDGYFQFDIYIRKDI